MQHNSSRNAGRGCGAAFLLALVSSSAPALADYPIASHRYLADPGSLVSRGRIYLYASNDDDNPVEGDYQMKSIVCISSSDLKNWTDHGEVLRVPANAAWANDSWAPAAVERNGRVYLYFGNNTNGIGVVSSDSPIGPFSDPIGKALVDFNTAGASGTNMWLFDPSVFIDDDGQAYLTFGGNADNNARVILLNSDMTSVAQPAIALTAANFFEASWLHKKGDLYYLSYSTTPATGQRIDYLTSSSPTSGYTYRGVVGDQPPSNQNNNHHSIFEFNGSWYYAYHNRTVSTEAAIPTTYRRNLALEPLAYASDGAIQQVSYTRDGVVQLASLNPYTRVEAETMNAQSGIETEPCSAGGMDVTDIQAGDWIKTRQVDFGGAGAAGFSVSVASTRDGGAIELHLDSPDGTLVGTCAVPGTGGAQAWSIATCPVSGATGLHDLYLKFSGDGSPLFNVDYWQFTPFGAPVEPGSDGGAGAGDLDGGGTFRPDAPQGGSAGESPGESPADAPSSVTQGAARRQSNGCACAVGSRSSSSSVPAALLAAAFLALRWRRRPARAS
jgi:arabinoxylan arabinofuranohydrolase